jgi:hypothetical protein
MKKYLRVIPRDFFNEAKLLKCLGMMALKILDNQQGISNYIFDEFDHEPFDIQQTIDGDIYVTNYYVYIKKTKEVIELYSTLNSRKVNPLCFVDEENSLTEVFDDAGQFSDEFLDFVKGKNK